MSNSILNQRWKQNKCYVSTNITDKKPCPSLLKRTSSLHFRFFNISIKKLYKQESVYLIYLKSISYIHHISKLSNFSYTGCPSPGKVSYYSIRSGLSFPPLVSVAGIFSYHNIVRLSLMSSLFY